MIQAKPSKSHNERKRRYPLIQEISEYSKKPYCHLIRKKRIKDKRSSKFKPFTDTNLHVHYQHEFSAETPGRTNADILLKFIESGNFPDMEFTDNVRKASREFRSSFKLHSNNQ